MGELTAAAIGKQVALDSAPLIYYLEEHPRYLAPASELFEAIRNNTAAGLSSILTLMEVLVRPLRGGHENLASDYRRLLSHTRGLTLFPVDQTICERAAKLRADHSWLRTPDALQIATALVHGADLIVTNDERWRRLPEIPVIVLSDYVETKA